MVQFTRLRLNGFKSFADRTEIEIGEGLTGVVGPNGCGKSNLVEALRWVMGENSAKRMRGDGMEDVIFNGTASRSSRNFAEVSVVLDNSAHDAPAAFNGLNEIEVVRRIERDQGSTYRINGKVVRARDTQMLFADIVAGANSPALVSQGRVTEMINAKPLERRKILEESAGISGLYARRHEAEIRLRAADANLVRINDSAGGLENQLNALRRQARQAAKYRNLSDEIAELQAILACLEWIQANDALETARSLLSSAESQVAEKLTVIAQLTRTLETQDAGMPELREAASKASAAWQTRNLGLQRLEEEEERLNETIKDLKHLLETLKADKIHEEENASDHSNVLERLAKEEAEIRKAAENEPAHLKDLEDKLATLKQARDEAEKTYQAALKDIAAREADMASKTRESETLARDSESLKEKISTLKGQIAALAGAETGDQAKILQAQIETTQKEIEVAQKDEDRLAAEIEKSDEAQKHFQADVSEARSALAVLDSEIRVLKTTLESLEDETFEPLLAAINAKSGYETALSRALGEALAASLDDKAQKSWFATSVTVKDLPPLPQGLTPLSDVVTGPALLKPALSMIGLAPDRAAAEKALKTLKAGQTIVTAQGDFWRWDGYRITADAPDTQSLLLKQKNRLKELEAETPKAQKELFKTEKSLASEQDKRATLLDKRKQARSAREEAERLLAQTRLDLKSYEDQQSRTLEERTRLNATLTQTEERLSETEARFKEAQSALKALEKAASNGDAVDIDALEKAAETVREAYHALASELEQAESVKRRREVRLHAIADEIVNLKNRSIRAKDQLEKIGKREVEARDKLHTLKDRPAEIEKEKQDILSSIGELESRKFDLNDRLQKAENELAETRRGLREKEQESMDAREARGRAAATLEAAQATCESVTASIAETFDLAPSALLSQHAKDLEALRKSEGEKIAAEPLRQKRDRLVRERESIGPVNLRAEAEAQDIETQLGTILSERNDLTKAIEELREAINKLNTEARDRLRTAFDLINNYFTHLFTRLFGGGTAYLQLIDSSDVLEAGLEIFAQPPGKSLQSLSLLSGGEQTLTSIALIFAMFLTNPAPVCVLDEIDAPLDDSNVDRVCNLLEEMVAKGTTRFLVITHHRLTMARMNRLYGVTMAERGISQLVSVDLQQKLDFLDAAE